MKRIVVFALVQNAALRVGLLVGQYILKFVVFTRWRDTEAGAFLPFPLLLLRTALLRLGMKRF